LPDKSDALARLDAQAEIREHLAPTGITECDFLERHGCARSRQRRGLWMIAQMMRHKKCSECL
jgi:hypothetical protein